MENEVYGNLKERTFLEYEFRVKSFIKSPY